ncbi:hypothetical protein PUN28_002683 [Cardiocondyla obscurior]|uniref:Uncharacterized protein n=1 Tax=Cardiocondyla obscurior TaxID=286306 RepID=A0AAW2GVH8_9HYME
MRIIKVIPYHRPILLTCLFQRVELLFAYSPVLLKFYNYFIRNCINSFKYNLETKDLNLFFNYLLISKVLICSFVFSQKPFQSGFVHVIVVKPGSNKDATQTRCGNNNGRTSNAVNSSRCTLIKL